MRLSGTKTSSVNQYNGLGDQLYDLGGARPTLDLNFSSNESLVDSVTGKTLVDHTRQSSATYVDGDGVIRTAVTNLLLRSEEFNNASWVLTSGSTVTENATPNPINSLTDADKFAVGTSSFPQIAQSTNTTVANTHTFSAYVKADGVDFVQLRVRNAGATSNYFRAIFNLTDGNITQNTTFGNGTYTSGSAVSVGNGWWRLSITGIADTSGTQAQPLFILTSDENGSVATPSTNDATDGIYIWGAQLEESSTVGQYVKTTTAINSAPRFDHEVTRTTTNFIPYSEAILSNALSGPNRTIVDNTILAPDGALTAATVTATGADPYIVISTLSGASAGTYTFSVYLKGHPNNSSQTCKLRIEDAGTGLQTSSSFDITGEWDRYSFTATTTGDLQTVRLDIPDVAVSGDIVYVWGFQIEANDDVGPYVKTTGAAATQVDTESLGLLVEEARTNSIRNNTMVGAVAGTPGTLPTNWSETLGGLTREVVSTGVNNGIDYIDIKFSGTSTGTQTTIRLEQVNQVLASINQTWTNSCYVSIASGSLTNISTVRLRLIERNSGGGYLQESSTIFSPTSSLLRYSHTQTLINSSTAYVEPNIFFTFAASAAIDITLRIGLPQLEQGAFATSVIPTTTSTVTRAADVTSITGRNFGSVNLLQYSEEFDQSGWNLPSGGTIAPNQEIAPDGTFTADHFITTSGLPIIRKTVTVTNGATYTISFYARLVTGGDQLKVDLGDGAEATFSLTSSWQRFTYTVAATANQWLDFRLVSAGTVALWGAQLEEGSTATDYIKSDVNFTSRGSTATYYDVNGVIQTAAVDEARTAAYLPDGNGNFVSAGDLLLEGAGTNLLEYSEDVTQSFSSTGVNRDLEQGTAPDGTNTANKLSGVNNSTDFLVRSGLSANTYTFSFWIKAVDGNTGTWGINWYAGSHNRSTVPVTDSWVRHSITFTSGALTNVYLADNRDGLADLTEALVWGAQLEANSYATSYIPTSGSTATRAADVSTSAATFGNSWYEQDEGTFFADIVGFPIGSGQFPRIFEASDGTTDNVIRSQQYSSNTVRNNVAAGGTVTMAQDGGTIAAGISGKTAFGVAENNCAIVTNGGTPLVDTTVTIPSNLNQLGILGTPGGVSLANSSISRFTYWPTRLSNDTLQTITT